MRPYGRVSAPMFSGRIHILAGLQCAEWLQIDMQILPTHRGHKIEKYTIIAIQCPSEAGPVVGGDEKLLNMQQIVA